MTNRHWDKRGNGASLLPALLWLLLVASGASAQAPAFDSVFGSHMVLPHDVPVTLSGRAAPNTALSLDVNGARYPVTSDAQGRWQTGIDPLPAGGPYEISLRDSTGAGPALTDLLAGEIWLCSGQSNMEFSLAISTDQPPAYNQGHPAVRLLTVPQRAEIARGDAFIEPPAWERATDDSVRQFSAVCYLTARKMIEQDGLPMGLIDASWGGSAIEAWISERSLDGLDGYTHPVNLLRQYRDNRREAELAFAADWIAWWATASDQGPVWEQGVLNTGAEWLEAPLQNWQTYADPRLQGFTGNLWFSRAFELSEAQSRQGASFVLGKIDEVDTTFLNGRFVNNSFGYGTRREYPLEPGMLRPGTNQFTVFVTNTYAAGGMMGPEQEIGLKFDDGRFLPLGTGWRYRFIPKRTGYPPRAPWESVHGVSGMFNGMIAPLQPLAPAGVIWYQGESNERNSEDYATLLTALVGDWRNHFDARLPVIVVQLPNYGEVTDGTAASPWATLRQAQQQVALADDQVGLVVTHDLGDDADIHPRRKYAVAVRAARVAGALAQGGVQDGVVPRIARIDDDKAVLEFSPSLQIVDEETAIAGFVLCRGDAENCVAARATQTGSRVDISLDALDTATTLRYCWSDGGQCQLKALNGLPVSSFALSLH